MRGRVLDSDGDPVPMCRVVVRVADGTDVFISAPSAADGEYSIAIPPNMTFVTVAAISPTGNRVGFPEPERWEVASAEVERDVQLPISMYPNPRSPRQVPRGEGSTVPLVRRGSAPDQEVPLRAQTFYADFDSGKRYGSVFLAAFQFARVPRMEWGIRASYEAANPDGILGNSTGAGDTDLWAKLHLWRSPRGYWDVAFGGLFTLPTGQADDGLGFDATQAKWFATASRTIGGIVVLGNAGRPRDRERGVVRRGAGRSGRALLGVAAIWPLWPWISLIGELDWEAERFEGFGAESRLLVGVNCDCSKTARCAGRSRRPG